MSFEKDLVILLPDLDIENTVTTLLTRPYSLDIRDISYDSVRHPERDPGCCRGSVDMLRRYQAIRKHALVIFDRHGSGRGDEDRQAIEQTIEEKLSNSGWEDRTAVIVLDPELEIWIWSDSSHVHRALGGPSRNDLKQFLIDDSWIAEGQAKPEKPKEAMEAALKHFNTPRSASIFETLARNVGVNRCTDPAFTKLKTVLKKWFPAKQ